MKSLNCLMDLTVCQNIRLSLVHHRGKFKIKSGYYLELLTPKKSSLLKSTGRKLTKDKNGENVPQLKITEGFLVHCDIVNNLYQHDSRVLSTFVPSYSFYQLLDISPTNHIYTEKFYS